MPLSRLPASDWRRIRSGNLGSDRFIPTDSWTIALPVHVERGKHKRGFCSECGSRMTGGEFDERPTGFVGALAGTLDDPSWFQPQMDIFVSDAQPWDQMDPAIPKFDQYPPQQTKE
jgi:hypothetical protein